jgi:hypothetical protein
MFFYAFNCVVIVGVGFLVFCLRCFIREASFRNTRLRRKSRVMDLRLKVLNSPLRKPRSSWDEQVEPTFSIVFPSRP